MSTPLPKKNLSHFGTDCWTRLHGRVGYSAEIRPESVEALVQMAQLLEVNPRIEVLVVGHIDNQGLNRTYMDAPPTRSAFSMWISELNTEPARSSVNA